MHEWHTDSSRDPKGLITSFSGFTFNTDYGGRTKVTRIKITDKVFSTEDEAISFVTEQSYGGDVPYFAAYTKKKLSKAYQNAFDHFRKLRKEWTEFRDNLTISYGRTASKVTCPHCGSSINLKYGSKFKACSICGSNEIISNSNWKILDTKKRMYEKAADNLKKEAEKNDVTFVCGIEWHC